MADARAAALQTLRADPARTCLITDFDGTLSPIVDDYTEARPLPGAVETLLRLCGAYGRVAVVSGRPAAFLAERLAVPPPLPPALRVSGLYGLESLDEQGAVRVVPAAEEWREPVETAAGRAEASAPRGVRVERKGLSVTLHWRRHPEVERWARGFASATADGLGLAVHGARRSLELRPPLDVDKGTAVSELASGFTAACYLGDDVGDLPAFAALDDLRGAGARTVKIVATSDEVAPEMLAAADLVLDGPEAALAFLAELAS
ncbi:MAG TPA: trehalose-phosphatase [Acidimicrobiales bacterium]|nr:trehalose-phosphatase [Acidimicrobiales bacterium]